MIRGQQGILKLFNFVRFIRFFRILRITRLHRVVRVSTRDIRKLCRSLEFDMAGTGNNRITYFSLLQVTVDGTMRIIITLGLTVLSILMISTGLIHLVENQQRLSFHDSFYLIVTTVHT